MVYDLYDIIIDILEEGFMEQCFTFENKKGMEHIVRAVDRDLLQVNDEESLIVKYIQEHTPKGGCHISDGSWKVLSTATLT